ncbi:ABC transporter permease [Acidiferrimicrobium sp. IK]|nr:ABC transporter permease [Acidiferrimicrobium sp. IK]MCU4184612.1 ABC transporter permease [Acidiferrimicrobium sp. IK]
MIQEPVAGAKRRDGPTSWWRGFQQRIGSGDASDLPWLLSSARSGGALVALTLDAFVAAGEAIVKRRFSYREFLAQAWFLVSVSLLPTLLIALPFGLVLVLEVGSLANQIGAPSFVGAVDAVGTVREAAPIITAIVLAGAGGSAICADLGARTVRDEVAALQVMGIDEVERLVAPRLLALLVVSVLLNGIVAMAGIVSGYLADVTVLHGTAGGFLNSFTTFAQAPDIVESELKAAVFGVLASVVSSFKGLNVKRGASGVGEAVNQSVVVTGVALFVVNLILTEIFLVLVPPPFV